MQLRHIRAWVVRVPLLEEWTSTLDVFGPHGGSGLHTLLCFGDEAGTRGWGEANGDQTAALEKVAPRLLGMDWEHICPSLLDLWGPGELYWNKPAPPSPYAANRANLRHRLRHPLQSLVEGTLVDLRAKRLGCPAAQLFGGFWRNAVLTDYWAGRVTPEHAARCAQRALELGFHGIKLKTALEDPDPERLEAIKAVAGEGFKITLDPNGRYYRLDDALPRLLELDAIGNLGVIEDPFPRFHMEEFTELRPRLKARVVLHIDPPESLPAVLAARAAGGLNLDSHAVGPFQWRIMAGAAEMANLPIWHGSGLNLGINTALQLHLAASAPNCVLPGDQIGPWVREASLVKERFIVRDGCVLVPQGPGIGVTPDRDAIEARCLKAATWSA